MNMKLHYNSKDTDSFFFFFGILKANDFDLTLQEKLITAIHIYFLAKVGHQMIRDTTKSGWAKQRVHIYRA